MTAETRVLPPEDLKRWTRLLKVAFMSSQEEAERWWLPDPEWTLATYVDGEIQAAASSIPLELWLEGSKIPMGGVTSVACMPEFRRQGLVADLLRRTLVSTKEKSQPLSALWTPHPDLYRRYGYEIATEWTIFEFHPKRVSLGPGPRPRGRLEELGPENWKEADRVYRNWGRRRNSLLGRDEVRWTKIVLEPDKRRAYLYRNAAGEAEGYAVLQPPVGDEHGERLMLVQEVVSLTGEAYRALVGLVLSHDLVRRALWYGPSDNPLPDVVDPAPLERRSQWGLMLRIVDLPEALALRPCYGEGKLTIAVRDEDCAWNNRTWLVFSAGSHLAAEPSEEAPMLTMDARALAQLFNGYRNATTLARAGRMHVHTERAVAIADILFAIRSVPFCGDDF